VVETRINQSPFAPAEEKRNVGLCSRCGGPVVSKLSALAFAMFLSHVIALVIIWPITLVVFLGCAFAARGRESPIGFGLPRMRSVIYYYVCAKCGRRTD
jgi:sugar phosphate permease